MHKSATGGIIGEVGIDPALSTNQHNGISDAKGTTVNGSASIRLDLLVFCCHFVHNSFNLLSLLSPAIAKVTKKRNLDAEQR